MTEYSSAMISLLLFAAVFVTPFSDCYTIKPGPKVIATKGEVWPKPRNQVTHDGYFVLRPTVFRFQAHDTDCSILNDAISRYQDIITYSGSLERRGRLSEIINRKYRKPWLSDAAFLGYVDALHIDYDKSCKDTDYPQYDMEEEYHLTVTTDAKVLSSKTIWGVLRGLETFSQLVHLANDEATLIVNSTEIHDYPRFQHRGLLIDTARHFIPLYSILQMLDAMAFNKLNVFHWHITDDQSFPYKSNRFPELSEYGAFHPKSKVYEPDDVKFVIDYARARGIRVLPEFDTPGHTRSWGEGIKELLTPCYDEGKPTGEYGPLDPTKNFTYSTLQDFFSEVTHVFPEKYTHLGGDEVSFTCWQSNPDIKKFMKDHSIATDEDLESYYINKLIQLVKSLGAKSIVWQEVFDNGVPLPNDTIVQVWKGDHPFKDMAKITAAGKPVLISAFWYLDMFEKSGCDWLKFYRCEPRSFNGTVFQKQLVLGGEACMWSEVVNEYNLASRVWPRASAIAERLWSHKTVSNETDAAARLEEHTCRMNNRGIAAQPPNGPGFCL